MNVKNGDFMNVKCLSPWRCHESEVASIQINTEEQGGL